MSNRTWYVAVDGKQAGPYPEDQFLEFIANGQIDRNSLVWSEGMASWQRAGYVPGLFARRSRRPRRPAAQPLRRLVRPNPRRSARSRTLSPRNPEISSTATAWTPNLAPCRSLAARCSMQSAWR